MNRLIKFVTIAFYIAIALFAAPAIADNLEKDTTSSLQQAAQKVIEDDGAKEQFGKSANGERLLDNAKTEASKKLTNLGKTDNVEDLPESKKLFLKNLTTE